MALDFPESPNPGDLFPAASPRWEWDGAKWSALSTGVIAFNGRTGGVTLVGEDISQAGGALTASPVFTGIPTAPTALHGVNDQQIATTAFVMSAISASTSGVSSWEGRTGAVNLTANDISARGGALVGSPSFTGVPQSVTPSAGSVATMIATKAYVDAGVGASVTSFNARTGAVTLQLSDVTGAGGAPLNNPALTGIPTAPTASPGTANQQLATTGFVAAALPAGQGVTSLNGKAGALSVSINQRMFTSSTTYAPTPGTVLAMVEAVGGSGGGGATSYGANWGMMGGGGGSGGYSRSILTAAQIGASQLITIGQGGVGAVGAQSPAATGQNGTATSFGTLVVANGGQGGQSMDAANLWGQAGPGASSGSGQLALAGNPGFVGGGSFRMSTGVAGNLCNGGNGGATFSGAGLGPFVGAGTGIVNGVNGTLGGGGSGGSMFMTGSPASGGNGGGGWCLVTELVLG